VLEIQLPLTDGLWLDDMTGNVSLQSICCANLEVVGLKAIQMVPIRMSICMAIGITIRIPI
jgi:hypothetical protein